MLNHEDTPEFKVLNPLTYTKGIMVELLLNFEKRLYETETS